MRTLLAYHRPSLGADTPRRFSPSASLLREYASDLPDSAEGHTLRPMPMSARIFVACLVGLAVVIHTWPRISGLPQGVATLFDAPMSVVASVGGFLDAHASAVIALFTLALFLATWRIYRHSVVSERAYVTISHRSPGLVIDRGRNEITIEVKNSGRTPAHVSDVFLCWLALPKGQKPPSKPQYPPPPRPVEPTTAFLVANDLFLVWRTFDDICGDHLDKIASGDETLWIYGYVDYTDASGQRHRGGYGRQYAPGRTENNLIFMTRSGYNYDRPLRWRRSA